MCHPAADRLSGQSAGTIFFGCHLRIIVQPEIPSLLGAYASASQALSLLESCHQLLYDACRTGGTASD
jgi:hypothetical protein